jgi:hypothetical protein
MACCAKTQDIKAKIVIITTTNMILTLAGVKQRAVPYKV